MGLRKSYTPWITANCDRQHPSAFRPAGDSDPSKCGALCMRGTSWWSDGTQASQCRIHLETFPHGHPTTAPICDLPHGATGTIWGPVPETYWTALHRSQKPEWHHEEVRRSMCHGNEHRLRCTEKGISHSAVEGVSTNALPSPVGGFWNVAARVTHSFISRGNGHRSQYPASAFSAGAEHDGNSIRTRF